MGGPEAGGRPSHRATALQVRGALPGSARRELPSVLEGAGVVMERRAPLVLVRYRR